MSTRFFEHQEEARRQSSRLVFLFACAVVGIVALLYLLAVMLTGGTPETDAYGRVMATPVSFWQPDLLIQVGLATLAIVSGGSLYKIWQLRGGGAIVAEHLGGQLVPTDTRDPESRKILNIVEEMAIASGTPTPPVYLLDREDGINAFAAGYTPSDAVIGVTRGAIHHLTRDELQGVIAHEFSHILNGDMRLNLRLMGVVHGILLIGIIGYFLIRSSTLMGGRRGNRDNSGAFLLAAGFGLLVIGSIGSFFGNLIKASVSRQHEFLADASAVQFTRNPEGIAGALKKIARLPAGSILISPAAPEASHLYFSQGLTGGLQSLFATHPPLAERIRRLDPSFQSDAMPAAQRGSSTSTGTAGFAGGDTATTVIDAGSTSHGAAIDRIGAPAAAHLDYAARLLASLPPSIVDACHEPHAARAIFYGLLINREPSARRRQLEQLSRSQEPGIAQETLAHLSEVEQVDRRARLPLVDMILPTLRHLSPSQYRSFERDVRSLVEADGNIDLFEWTLQRILLAHLRPHFERSVASSKQHLPLSRLAPESSIVLSMLARFGNAGDAAVQKAFGKGASTLGGVPVRLLPPDGLTLPTLDQALDRLAQADADAVQRLLSACAICIAADGIVSEAQGELVRAIADSLGAPMPPLLPGQKLT